MANNIDNTEEAFSNMVTDFLEDNKDIKELFKGIASGNPRKCTEEDAKKVQDFIGEMGVKMGVYKDKNDIWEKK
jgi:GTP-binding protein EngB required for normal cell division